MKIIKALGGSCAVYLTPLVGPHGLFLPGGWLAMVRRRLAGNTQWATAEVAVALVLQSVAFFVLLWHFTRRSRTTFALVSGAVPLTLIAANWAYLLALPTWFLIDPDQRRELTTWREVCRANGWRIEPARTASFAAVPLVGSEQDYGILRMPGCEALPIAKRDSRHVIESISPSGSMILRSGDERWFRKIAGGERIQISADPGDTVAVSDDGMYAGVLRGRDLRILPVRNEPILLRLPQPGSYALAGLDASRERALILRNSSELWTIGFDGNPSGSPLNLGTTVLNNAQLGDGHWLVWDAYRERGRPNVLWSHSDGVRKHEVPAGRLICSAARSPSGRLIAISTSTALNIGSFPDTVYVLRASDGFEVYHKKLARYSRTSVYFPDDGHFAYTRSEKNRSEVVVLQVPLL